MKKLYTLFTMLALSKVLLAQSPADLQFVPKGNICAGLTYGYSNWDHYWEGDTLRTNGNVGNVTRQQITAGFNIGILDRLNLIVMLPYLFTNTNSGTLNGQSGISDISLNLKGKFAELTLGKGKIFIAGNLGFSTPVSNYLVDFGPVNIGNGTTNLSYRQMFEYKFDKGLFINAKANYTYRSNVPDIHRGEFYFDNGEAYYSNEVYVPNQFDWGAAVGYKKTNFLIEADYTANYTLGGTDIRTWDAGFPTNKVNYTTVYGRVDYYMSNPQGLNFSLNAGYTLSGRNTGKPYFFNISVNYLFGLWKKVAPVE